MRLRIHHLGGRRPAARYSAVLAGSTVLVNATASRVARTATGAAWSLVPPPRLDVDAQSDLLNEAMLEVTPGSAVEMQPSAYRLMCCLADAQGGDEPVM
jgi:hypothetical protein